MSENIIMYFLSNGGGNALQLVLIGILTIIYRKFSKEQCQELAEIKERIIRLEIELANLKEIRKAVPLEKFPLNSTGKIDLSNIHYVNSAPKNTKG